MEFLIDEPLLPPPGKHRRFLSFLNPPLSPPTSSFLLNSSILTFKMASVARAFRPLASRALAQKPAAPICRATPAFRFPRGTRSFSQSPLGECRCPLSCPLALVEAISVQIDYHV